MLATEAQTRFIVHLLSDRQVDALRAERIRVCMESGTMDRAYASEAITYLKARPRIAQPMTQYDHPQEPEEYLSEGMYLKDGQVFRVQRSRDSGRLYAKVLVHALEDDKWHFDYAAGAIRHLLPEHRMSLEQAQEYGVQMGVCCVCGAILTDPSSITAGIGPICAQKF